MEWRAGLRARFRGASPVQLNWIGSEVSYNQKVTNAQVIHLKVVFANKTKSGNEARTHQRQWLYVYPRVVVGWGQTQRKAGSSNRG